MRTSPVSCDTPACALVQTPTGDQPADIEAQVRDTWLGYITRPDAIILAVAPATQDLFADEAIKTALEVDPEGDRTVGALQAAPSRGERCTRYCRLAGRRLSLPSFRVPACARVAA